MTLRIVLNTADSFRSSAKTKGEKFGSVAPLPVNYPTTVFKNRQSCLRKLVFGDHHPINKPVKLSTQAKKKDSILIVEEIHLPDVNQSSAFFFKARQDEHGSPPHETSYC